MTVDRHVNAQISVLLLEEKMRFRLIFSVTLSFFSKRFSVGVADNVTIVTKSSVVLREIRFELAGTRN